MTETVLEAKGITKEFRASGNQLSILRGVDFSIQRGERVAVLGTSGAGKSTLLHILGTLESATAGELNFGKTALHSMDETALSTFRNRELGFVFQFHYLMLEFTALENVMMPVLIAGYSEDEARARALVLLEKVGLGARVEHRPSQLSGGEQQRVAIARALVMQPKLLLTDEMTGNLDPQTAGQVFDLVLSLLEQSPMAVLSVTHDEKLARRYSRVLKLVDGKLVDA